MSVSLESFMVASSGKQCLWCGHKLDFVATCPGVCLPCGDALQQKSKPELIMAFAQAILESCELVVAARKLLMVSLPPTDVSGSRMYREAEVIVDEIANKIAKGSA